MPNCAFLSVCNAEINHFIPILSKFGAEEETTTSGCPWDEVLLSITGFVIGVQYILLEPHHSPGR